MEIGAKKITLLGDQIHLKPVHSVPISDENVKTTKRKTIRQFADDLEGQLLYQKYLLTNTVLNCCKEFVAGS